MKKIALMLLCLSAAAGSKAQLYIRAGAGYALPMAANTLNNGAEGYIAASPGAYNSYSVKKYTYSKGLQGIAGIGYLINKHIGVQVDAVMGISNPVTEYNAINETVYYSSGPRLDDIYVKQNANHQLILIPSLLVQTGGNIWNIYCRMGLALPVQTKISRALIYIDPLPSGSVDEIEATRRYSNTFSLGLAAAAGLSYKISHRWSVWTEASMLSLSVNAKKSELQTYRYNGYYYNTARFSDATRIYTANGTYTAAGSSSPTFAFPFSNAGLTLGVQLQLSAAKKHSS